MVAQRALMLWARVPALAVAVALWSTPSAAISPALELPREKPTSNPSELAWGWLGLRLEDCPRLSQERKGTQVVVREVKPSTPAAKAGVRRGDVILFVQDQLVRSVKQVVELLRDVPPGSLVPFELLRSGDYVILAVTVSAFPADSVLGSGPPVSDKPAQQRGAAKWKPAAP